MAKPKSITWTVYKIAAKRLLLHGRSRQQARRNSEGGEEFKQPARSSMGCVDHETEAAIMAATSARKG
jgi:hypothetical protein